MHVSPEPSSTAIADQFRRAGLHALTPLQRRLVPLVFRGRDAAAETAKGSGGTTAALYTLIIGYRGRSTSAAADGAAPLALLVAADADEVAQIGREWARFAKALGRAPTFAAVGEVEDARREQRRLGAGVAVVAGTPARVIDHLRRGSLRLDALETLVVSLPEGEAREGFVRDVQFVLEKCPARRHTVLLGRPPLAGQEELLAIAHHPDVVSAGEPPEEAASREALPCGSLEREEALVRLLLALPAGPVLVLHGTRPAGERAVRRLRDVGIRTESLAPGAGLPARRRLVAALAAGTCDALLVPLPVPEDIDVEDASCVVWLDLPQPRDARRALPSRPRLVALVGAGQARDLARLQEAIGVTMKTLPMPGDADVLGGAIDRIVSRMAEEDPAELARLAALVRRRVPLLRRTALAAFLLKDRLPRLPGPAAAPAASAGDAGARAPAGQRGEGGGRREARGDREGRREPRGAREGRGEGRSEGRSDREPRDEGRREPRGAREGRGGQGSGHAREVAPGYTLLFVNAGRNRRVFARDLSALFNERLGLAEGEIGAVRVFDKYSFVEIASGRAADAVAHLSGVELKGRALNVEIAKRKEENPDR